MSDQKLLGRWGEKYCEKFLRKKGYKTLTRNFSCKTGEIDLIMVDGEGTIVFVEVKTRSADQLAPPESSVTLDKQRKAARTARFGWAWNTAPIVSAAVGSSWGCCSLAVS